MDKDFAILMINACYRASREIGEIGVMIREFVPGSEGTDIKMQAGAVVAEIGKITETIYKKYPELESYVESRIDKYGRVS